MLKIFQDKKILLIIPKFFGYERIIVSRLEQAGATVTMIYENMDEVSYYYRFINAYLPKRMPKVMNDYFLNKILPIAHDLDFVLLIRGEFLNPEVLDILRRETPDYCKFFMYQWDSVKNNNNVLRISRYFDFISTFDPVDAKMYGWQYRPLFYIPELVNMDKEDIDVLYLCSLHSNRIEVLNQLKKMCEIKNLTLYKGVYSKKIIFYKRKYLNRREGYILADNADIFSKKMDVSDTYELYNRSRIIVDYTHPRQNGFTMRTFETLGCGKKLVTNNKRIIDTDFYNPNNIYVYDGEMVEIPDAFIKSQYHTLEKEIYEKYSVDTWLSSIMQSSGGQV